MPAEHCPKCNPDAARPLRLCAACTATLQVQDATRRAAAARRTQARDLHRSGA